MLQTARARSPEPHRRLARPLFIGNEIYRRSNFGPKHPLSVPRVPATLDLCRAMGWLPDKAYIESAAASSTSLNILAITALIGIPGVIAYQSWSFWVFRGRLRPSELAQSAYK